MNPKRTRLALFAIFFISGACSLVYQIVWTRMMQVVFGVSVFAVSAVVCAFMTGLAGGSFVFGRVADRTRRPLFLYGITEIGIAALALAFPPLLDAMRPVFVWAHRTFYSPDPSSYYVFSLIRFLIILPLLLAPTFLMGGTLPLISRHFIRGPKSVALLLGRLYGMNTLGAVAGTFFAGFVLIALLGSTGALIFAGLANLGIGVATTWIGWKDPRAGLEGDDLDSADAPASSESAPADASAASRSKDAESDARPRRAGRRRKGSAKPAGSAREAASPVAAAPSPPPRWTVPLVMICMGVTGFVSLALQVLWTRMMVYYTNNSTYAFSSMLCVFLFGLATGGWATGLVAHRARRPLVWLAIAVLGIGLWGAFSLLLLDRMFQITRAIAETFELPGWYRVIVVLFGQCSSMFLVPTFLMGTTLPLAVQVATTSGENVGRRIGDIYGANTVGTVLGSFAAGFLLIPILGVRNSVVAVAGANLAVAAILLLPQPGFPRWAKGTALAGALALVFVMDRAVPADIVSRQFVQNLTVKRDLLFYEEDITDTIMVWDPVSDGRVVTEERDVFFGDGRANGGHRTRVEDHFYGHLPMFLHPDPQEVLSIGVCSGNTIGAITRHATMKHLDAVELSAGVVEATKWIETNYGIFHDRPDPRVTLHIEDGRNFLLGTERQYDVININPPYVHTAGVVFLYTREFFELCRARLKPGGVVSHFIEPGRLSTEEQKMLLETFASVFPHVTVWHGPRLYSWNLVGSDRPISFRYEEVRRRIAEDPILRQSLREDKLQDPNFLPGLLLMKDESVRRYVAENGRRSRIVTDDRTVLDFSSPRTEYSGFAFFRLMPGETVDESQYIRPAEGGIFVRTPDPEGDEGGYANVARLNARSDSGTDLVDWTGVSDEERVRIEGEIRHLADLRRKAVNLLYAHRQVKGQ